MGKFCYIFLHRLNNKLYIDMLLKLRHKLHKEQHKIVLKQRSVLDLISFDDLYDKLVLLKNDEYNNV